MFYIISHCVKFRVLISILTPSIYKILEIEAKINEYDKRIDSLLSNITSNYKGIDSLVNMINLLSNIYLSNNNENFFDKFFKNKSKKIVKAATLTSISEQIINDNLKILEQIRCYEKIKLDIQGYFKDIDDFTKLLKSEIEKSINTDDVLLSSDYETRKIFLTNKLECLNNSKVLKKTCYLKLNEEITKQSILSNIFSFFKDIIIPILLSENSNETHIFMCEVLGVFASLTKSNELEISVSDLSNIFKTLMDISKERLNDQDISNQDSYIKHKQILNKKSY